VLSLETVPGDFTLFVYYNLLFIDDRLSCFLYSSILV